MKRKIRIGTRGSKLALVQSGLVKWGLEAAFPDVEFALKTIRTKGDVLADEPLVKAGGKGLFVGEIEEALLRGDVDLAVHSAKDLPTDQPAGLVLASVPQRDDPRDVLITASGARFEELKSGALLGTGSPRRSSQLLAKRPDLRPVNIRGNVDTRLRKLKRGDCDALLLAAAGLRRLGLASVITEYLDEDLCIPAVGQAALAIEARVQDREVLQMLQAMNHQPSMQAVLAERAFLRRLGGGCAVPASAHATIEGCRLRILGFVGSIDGRTLYRDEAEGDAELSERVGIALAEKLLAAGAGELLAERP